MNATNKIGLAGAAALVLAALVTTGPVEFEAVSLTLQWVGILLLIYAGIRGTRWWFTPPIAIILVWVWALSQGH